MKLYEFALFFCGWIASVSCDLVIQGHYALAFFLFLAAIVFYCIYQINFISVKHQAWKDFEEFCKRMGMG